MVISKRLNAGIKTNSSRIDCADGSGPYLTEYLYQVPTAPLDRAEEFERKKNAHKFNDIAESIGRLVAQKNARYGDSAGRTAKLLKVLWPDGIPPTSYDDAQLIIRILDKLNRLAAGDRTARLDAWRDITGYGVLGVEQSERTKE